MITVPRNLLCMLLLQLCLEKERERERQRDRERETDRQTDTQAEEEEELLKCTLTQKSPAHRYAHVTDALKITLHFTKNLEINR